MLLSESIKLKIIELFNIQEESKKTDDELKKLIEKLPASEILRIFDKLFSDEIISFVKYYRSVKPEINRLNYQSLTDPEIALMAFVIEDATTSPLRSMKSNDCLTETPNVSRSIESMKKFIHMKTNQVISLECDDSKLYHYLNLSLRKMSFGILRNPPEGDLRDPIPSVVIHGSGAEFNTYSFNDIYCLDSVFNKANFFSISFTNGAIYKTSFENSIFALINDHAHPKYNQFSGMLLKSVSFNHANLSHVAFNEKTILNGVTFKGARLNVVSFSNGSLNHVDFSELNELDNVIFRKIILSNVSFVNVDISKIAFVDVTFESIKMLGQCNVNSLAGKLKKLNEQIRRHAQADDLKMALLNEVIAIAESLSDNEAVTFLEEAKKSTIFLYLVSDNYSGIVANKDDKSQEIFEKEIAKRAGDSSLRINFSNIASHELDGCNINSIKNKLDELDKAWQDNAQRKDLKEIICNDVIKIASTLDKDNAIAFLENAKKSSLFLFDSSEGFFLRNTYDDIESEETLQRKIALFHYIPKDEFLKKSHIFSLATINYQQSSNDSATIRDRIDVVLKNLNKKDILIVWDECARRTKNKTTISKCFTIEEVEKRSAHQLLKNGMDMLCQHTLSHDVLKRAILCNLFRVSIKNDLYYFGEFISQIKEKIRVYLNQEGKANNSLSQNNLNNKKIIEEFNMDEYSDQVVSHVHIKKIICHVYHAGYGTISVHNINNLSLKEVYIDSYNVIKGRIFSSGEWNNVTFKYGSLVMEILTFDNFILKNVNFLKATLSNVTFQNCHFKNVNFENCNSGHYYSNIVFDNCYLEDLSLIGTNLKLFKFVNVKFGRIKLLGKCDISLLDEKLDVLSDQVNSHDQVIELRQALVNEIIEIAVKLNRSDALAFLQKAHVHKKIFEHRGASGMLAGAIFSYESDAKKKLKHKMALFSRLTEEEFKASCYSDTLDAIHYSSSSQEDELKKRIDDIFKHLTKKDILLAWDDAAQAFIKRGASFAGLTQWRQVKVAYRDFSDKEIYEYEPYRLLTEGMYALRRASVGDYSCATPNYDSQFRYFLSRFFRVKMDENQNDLWKKFVEIIDGRFDYKTNTYDEKENFDINSRRYEHDRTLTPDSWL